MSSTAKQMPTTRKSSRKRNGAFRKRNWFMRLLGDERGAELAEICVAGVCVCSVVGICFKVFEGQIPSVARLVIGKLYNAVSGEMPANNAIVPAQPAEGSRAAAQ
jgi:hypothetical protein